MIFRKHQRLEECGGLSTANNIGIGLMLLANLLACSKDTRLRWKATHGDPAAMRELGEKLRGMGNHIDGNEGLKWLEMAAKAGDTQAMYSLGSEYDSPPGSNLKAYSWYRRGAEAGNEQCMYKVAQAYLHGEFGLEKDPVKSKFWFDKIEVLVKNRRGY